MKFELDGETLTITRRQYVDGKGLCLRVVDETGSPYATLSVNIPNVKLGEGEVIVKTYAENSRVAAACAHLFEDTRRRVNAGYRVAEIWRIK